MAPSSDDRFAATRENVEPLIRAAMAVVGAAFLVARREHHLGRLGGAVAGDYAESPAEPQLLLKQSLRVLRLPYYCFEVLLEPVAGVEVLPEPVPMPELAAPGVVGAVDAPPLLDEPEPALPVDGVVVDELPLDESLR